MRLSVRHKNRMKEREGMTEKGIERVTLEERKIDRMVIEERQREKEKQR